MPQKGSSKWADHGTMKHTVLEQCLMSARQIDAATFIGEEFKFATETFTFSEEDAACVQIAIDYARKRFEDAKRDAGGADNCQSWCEQKVKVADECWGTLDIGVYAGEEWLEVIDYKGGSGIPVEAVGNKQAGPYIVGLLKLLHNRPAPKKIIFTIVQPSCFHKDGPIRSWEISLLDALDIEADIEDELEATRDPKAKPNPGPWCRWCSATVICPAMKDVANEAAKTDFAPPTAGDAGVDMDALAAQLQTVEVLEAYIKSVREFAYETAQRGHKIPGFKLVQKRAIRKWRDDAEVMDWGEAMGVEVYGDRPLLSPAQVEKRLPGKLKAAVDKMTVKQSSGLTLVSEDDKRPEASVTAEGDFDNPLL